MSRAIAALMLRPSLFDSFRANCFQAARRHFSVTTTNNLKASWGFIGLGQMGYNMAKNLRQKIPVEDSLVIHDVNTAVTSKFINEFPDQKAVVAKSAREVAEKAETTISALPSPSLVKTVYESITKPGPLPDLSKARLFIDTSTIDPATSISVAESIAQHGTGSFIDAPMSGGVVGASAGTLTFMLGCLDSQVPQATEALSMMGRRIVHMGPPGSGLKAKLANNYLLALNNIATCEAMHMGIAWGLKPAALAALINMSTGKCWPSEVNNPVPGVVSTAPAGRDFDGGFGVTLMNKDLKLALKACADANISVALGDEAREVYDAIESSPELKGKDFSVVYRWLGGKEH